MERKKEPSYFRQSWSFVKQSRNYIYFISLVFLFFLIIGVAFATPEEIALKLKEMIKQLVERVEGLNALELIWFIFKNNFFIAVISIFAGIFFCFVPFLIALANGYVLGFAIRLVLEKIGGNDGLFYLWRLLPHGIFELPAILISLGIGIRLGASFFSSLGKNSFKEFFGNFLLAMRALVFIILPLLIIAAVIEGSLMKLLG